MLCLAYLSFRIQAVLSLLFQQISNTLVNRWIHKGSRTSKVFSNLNDSMGLICKTTQADISPYMMSLSISSFCKLVVLAVPTHCNFFLCSRGHGAATPKWLLGRSLLPAGPVTFKAGQLARELLVTAPWAPNSKGNLRSPNLVLCDLASWVLSAEVSSFNASSCIKQKQQCHHDPKSSVTVTAVSLWPSLAAAPWTGAGGARTEALQVN